MRDFIGGFCIFCVLVSFFSIFYYEEHEETQKNGNFVILVESGQESTQRPTNCTEPYIEEPKKPPTKNDPTEPSDNPIMTIPTKTIDELAWEVIIGYWGYMDDRWQRLTEAGYDAKAVQERVNEILREELLWQ